MSVEHYCIGNSAGRYLHVASDDEDVAPHLIVFQSQEIARQYLGPLALAYSVMAVDPFDLEDPDLRLEDQYIFLGIDVRDGKLLCLELSYAEFYEQLSWSFELDEDREPLEMLPLQRSGSSPPPSDIESVAESDLDQK